ncbi:adenosylcobinamide-GDP ribazoletransferase, partial [Pseudacidovorax intermedius]
MNGVRHFLLALQFFTRIPVTGRLAAWVGYSPQMLRGSAAHFPGVGWVVGLIAAVVFALGLAGLRGPMGALAAAVLATAVTVWATGGFHEDGLADTADGLGGSSQRERALEIMKDSRIGSFGALALVLALGLKAALLATLAEQGAAAAVASLLAAHVLSRLA